MSEVNILEKSNKLNERTNCTANEASVDDESIESEDSLDEEEILSRLGAAAFGNKCPSPSIEIKYK